MENAQWPQSWTVRLDEGYEVTLPLMDLGDGFKIYSFDMTGEAEWNRHAAAALKERLKGYGYDAFVTVQTKSSGLAQEMARDDTRYLELRKAFKGFMLEPRHVSVQSITTKNRQELWIGKEKYAPFVGKKLCFLDDVVSTGGTIDAMLLMAKEIGFEIAVIACVLTEGERRTEYQGIPLVCLDHIPLPGCSACMDPAK